MLFFLSLTFFLIQSPFLLIINVFPTLSTYQIVFSFLFNKISLSLYLFLSLIMYILCLYIATHHLYYFLYAIACIVFGYSHSPICAYLYTLPLSQYVPASLSFSITLWSISLTFTTPQQVLLTLFSIYLIILSIWAALSFTLSLHTAKTCLTHTHRNMGTHLMHSSTHTHTQRDTHTYVLTLAYLPHIGMPNQKFISPYLTMNQYHSLILSIF